jgi:hypothetical protein
MPLTIDQLTKGIHYWNTSTWPQDFHNSFYRDLAPTLRPKEGKFDSEWWDRFYPILKDWGATRKSGTNLTTEVQKQFANLSKEWSNVIAPHLNDDIENVDWPQIASFPPLATQIKWLVFPNPMFTSKFCHFLVPRIFPISDQKAVGNPFPKYEDYYRFAREEWLSTDTATQTDLINVLTQSINGPVFSEYPMKCKLVELCFIGRRDPS